MTAADWVADTRKRIDAATPGPWEADHTEPGVWSPEVIVMGNYTANDGFDSAMWADGTTEDRDFIAASRARLPEAVDAIQAVLAVADGLERAHDANPKFPYEFGLLAAATAIRSALDAALTRKDTDGTP